MFSQISQNLVNYLFPEFRTILMQSVGPTDHIVAENLSVLFVGFARISYWRFVVVR
jgi:hypothetical protein